MKEYKQQFEQLATEANKFAPQQDSLTKISECEQEAARFEAQSKNEEIERK